MTGPLLVEQDGGIRWLRLNRPRRRNALDPTLVEALDEAVEDAMADSATMVVVIAGTGPSFCAGADLFYLHALAERDEDPLPFLTTIADCFDRIERGNKPVVACLHGHAVAGGLELALACDVVVAETGTLIGDGHVRNGLVPAGGSSVRLPHKVGASLARWLILSGQLLPAERFTATGFVHVTADHDRIGEVTTAVAETLVGNAGPAQRYSKDLLITQQDVASSAAGAAVEREMFAGNWRNGGVARRLAAFTATEIDNGSEVAWHSDTPAASC